MLVEPAEEEDFVFPDGTAERGSALLLAAMRLESHHGIGRAESAVADVVEAGAVPVIGARFGDDVDDCTAGASLLRTVGIRGDAELLDDFVGELVGRAIQAASLGEEGVVEIAAIDQEAVLKSAQATERKIAVGSGGERARVLRDAGREQYEIGEAAAVKGEIGDGAFVEEGGDGARLGIDEFGGAGNGEGFFESGDGEVKIQFGRSANVHMEERSFLRRHFVGDGAGNVIAGRQKFEREAALGIGSGGVTGAGGRVDGDHGSLGNEAAGRIENGALNGAGGCVLGEGEGS